MSTNQIQYTPQVEDKEEEINYKQEFEEKLEILSDEMFLKNKGDVFYSELVELLSGNSEDLYRKSNEIKTFEKEVKLATPIPITVGKKIESERLRNKLTRKQLSSKLNIKETLLSSYENGKAIPDREILRKLRRILNSNKF